MMNLEEACVRKETTLYQLAFDSGVSYPRLLMVASGTVRLLEAEETKIENMLAAVKEIDWGEMFGKRQIYSLQVARLARSVPQAVLAKHAGVSQSRISQHEAEGLKLNSKEKFKIENVMNLINKINWEEDIMKEEPMEMPEMKFRRKTDSEVKNLADKKSGKSKDKGNETNTMPAMAFKKGE